MVEEPLSHRTTKVIGCGFSSAIKRFHADIPRAHNETYVFRYPIITAGIGRTALGATFQAIDLRQGDPPWTLP
jgi:hypothetical protein